MMKQNNLEPKRRFENFEEDWEQYELKESVELENGYAFKSRYFQSDVTKEIVLTPGNVNIGGGFQVGKGHYYDASEDYPEKTVMKPGDIFVTMTDLTPSAQTLGFPAIIPDDGNVYLHNQRLGKLVNYKLDNKFLFNLLSTIKYHNQIVNTASGTTVKHTSPQRILSSLVSVPSIEEQKKVGQFFTHLDDMIALQQKKIDKTNALKSAYLAEMFPAEGERVPKRRFAGYIDKWEERYFLDNIKSIIDFRGRTPKKLGLEWSEKGYLALSALNVKNGYIDFKAEGHYGNQELYDKWMIGHELQKGQVLFTTEAPMGNVAQVPDNRGYILSQRTIAFDVMPEKITNEFMAYLLRSDRTFKELSVLSSGGTAKGVSQRSLEELKVLVPKNLNEQFKIGNFFKKLDNTITTHQQKLDKLKATKQAYLNEMFV